jgi:hypothetical protein
MKAALLEQLQYWVDWYEVNYGHIGDSPGRELWEETKYLIKYIQTQQD